MLYVILFWSIGLICAPFMYSYSLAYFQKENPFIAKKQFRSDVILCIAFSSWTIFTGPLMFLLFYFWIFRPANHGRMWWRK